MFTVCGLFGRGEIIAKIPDAFLPDDITDNDNDTAKYRFLDHEPDKLNDVPLLSACSNSQRSCPLKVPVYQYNLKHPY